MVKKLFLLSLVLFGLLFLVISDKCFADASSLLKHAETYKNEGNYEQAEAIYQQIIADFIGSDYALEAQKKLTLIYIATDRQQQADEAFDALTAGFSEHNEIAKAVYQIAQDGYNKAKKYDKAVQIHQYNVEHFSSDMYAMWSQVEVTYFHINSGDNTAADAAFEKLLMLFSIQPTLPKEIYQIAMKYNLLERYEKAFELYQYNAEHSSKDDIYTMWSQVEIVKSHIRDANDAAADAAYNKLLNVFSEQPTLPKEVYQIANIYKDVGQSSRASRLYQHVVDNWPKSEQAVPAQMNLVIYYVDQGDDLYAQAAADKLIANFSDNSQITKAVHDVAEHYRLSGKHEKANQLDQYNVDNFSSDIYTMWSQVEIVKYHIHDANDDAADAAYDTLISKFPEQPTLSK